MTDSAVVARHRKRGTGYVAVKPGKGGQTKVTTEAGASYLVSSDAIEPVGKTTPELSDILDKKRSPGRPKKSESVRTQTSAPTAEQIADSIEAEAERLKDIVGILRGKA